MLFAVPIAGAAAAASAAVAVATPVAYVPEIIVLAA